VKLDKLVDMQLEMQGQMETAQEGNNKLLKQEMQGINIQLSQMARSLASMVEVVDTVQEECERKRSQGGGNGKPEEKAPEQVKDKEEGVAVQDGGGAERDATAPFSPAKSSKGGKKARRGKARAVADNRVSVVQLESPQKGEDMFKQTRKKPAQQTDGQAAEIQQQPEADVLSFKPSHQSIAS